MPLPTFGSLVRLLAAAAFAVAPTAPRLLTQAAPLWEDYLGASASAEAFAILAEAPGGDYYAAGIADVTDAPPAGTTVAATVYRIGADGEARWDVRLMSDSGGDLLPVGLHPRQTGDSVVIALAELGPGERAGALYLTAVGAGDGGLGALRPIGGLPRTLAYRPGASTPVPGTDDLIVAGELEGLSRGGDRAFVARVRPDGSVAWFNDDIQVGGTIESLNYITDVRVVGDAVYAVARRGFARVLGVFGLATGAVTGALAFPAAASSFSDSYLAASADTVYWLTVDPLGGERGLRVARVVDGAVAAFAEAPLGFDDRFSRVYGVRAGQGGALEVVGGDLGLVTRVRFDADGGEVARETTTGPAFGRPNRAVGPQSALVTAEGAVVLAGQVAEGARGTDAALVRFGTDGEVEALAVFGEPDAGGGDPSAVAVVPRGDDDGVHVVYVTDGRLYLRTLDPAGSPVAETSVETGSVATDFLGAAPFPDGSLLAFVGLNDGGAFDRPDYVLLRVGPDGTVLGESNLGELPGFRAPRGSAVAATPAGLVRVSYSAGLGTKPFAELFAVDTNLTEGDFATVELERDTLATISDVFDVPGSADRIIYGETRSPAADPNYVARVTPAGDVVWRYVRSEDDRGGRYLYAVAQGDRYAFLTDELTLTTLGADGTLVDQRSLGELTGLDGGVYDEPLDIRTAGDDLVVAYVPGGVNAETGRYEAFVRFGRVDVDAGTVVPLLTLPAGVTPTSYRESRGRTYVVGSAERGLGRRGYVGAWTGELSPTPATADVHAAVGIFPNPARPGQALRLDADLDVATWHLYDALGSRVTTVLAQAGRLTVPQVPPGVYRLVGQGGSGGGRSGAGPTAVATLLVR